MAKQSFSRLIKIATGARAEKELHPQNDSSRLEHFAHFWAFVAKSFVHNRCLVRASALSYTTLLAMIPLLAIAISVTSSLLKKEGEQQIYHAVDKFVSHIVPPANLATNEPPSQTESPANAPANSISENTNAVAASPAAASPRVAAAQTEAARRIHEFIRNTRSGTLGLTGMALLIFVAISMLNSIENTFNDIWGVQRGRGWLARVVIYWTVISLGPLLLAVAFGLAGGSHFQSTKAVVEKLPFIGVLIFQSATLIVLWLTFALFYQFVPNTKVQFKAALAGGVVGGTLWHLNNLFGFLYVSRVVTYKNMYGGLGMVPVFMAGLYLSWAILLFGAQVAYAFQNRKIYLQEKLVETVSHRGREIVALRLMTCIARRFHNGEKPASVQEISGELEIPTKLAQQVLQTLLAAQIVTEISGVAAYAPARPLDAINAHDILRAMRAGGDEQELFLPNEPVTAEVLSEFEKIEKAECAAAAPLTLLALVQRTQKIEK